jgi:hypothetical protein
MVTGRLSGLGGLSKTTIEMDREKRGLQTDYIVASNMSPAEERAGWGSRRPLRTAASTPLLLTLSSSSSGTEVTEESNEVGLS